MMNYFYFAGKSSADFGVYISDAGVYATPNRNYDPISIPGRNGDLIMENNKFDNVEHVYPAILMKDFDANYKSFVAFLCAQKGYQKLTDSFHPDEYYMATFNGVENLNHSIGEKAGTFAIMFNRKPQRYLKSGEKKITFIGTDGSIKNPTLYTALPLIRAYGSSASLTVNGVSVMINSASEYTDLDCELQEAYKGTTNCNGNITLTNGVFPSLAPGVNRISRASGIWKIEIIPRWWTI